MLFQIDRSGFGSCVPQPCLLLCMLRFMQIPLMHGTTSHLVSQHVISVCIIVLTSCIMPNFA